MADERGKSEETHIEYVPLSAVERWPRNPKLHAEDALDRSIDRFGFVAPLIVDEGTGRLVAGHGRLDALIARRQKGLPPPARVREDAGEWLVPVVRGVRFKDEREAEGYLIADNRLGEVGGWDYAELARILRDVSSDALGLDGLGYTLRDVQALISTVPPAAEFEEFDANAADGVEAGKVTCPKCGAEFVP